MKTKSIFSFLENPPSQSLKMWLDFVFGFVTDFVILVLGIAVIVFIIVLGVEHLG